MLNPTALQPKGLAFLVVVCLAFFCSSVQAAPNPDVLWNQAIDSFDHKDPKAACSELKDWIKSQELEHIQSAEAYFNLSICSWEEKQPEESVFWLVQSLNSRNSLFKRFSDITFLQSIQKEIGIRDHLASKLSFILKMLFPSWLAQVFWILGFWSLLFYFLFNKKLNFLSPVCFSMTAFSWVIAGTLLLLTQIGGPVAVISSTEPVSLFTFDKLGKPIELATLPNGTLIELGQSKDTNLQILKPISGWVKKETVKLILPSP